MISEQMQLSVNTGKRTIQGFLKRNIRGVPGCFDALLDINIDDLTFDLMYAIIGYFGMLPMTRFWIFVESLAASTPDGNPS